jgi:hypothetical protein
MTIDRASLLIGLLAGFATALLSLSAGTPSSLSFFLLSCVTLPVFIASLGWGDIAGAISVAVACALIAFGLSPVVALMLLVTSLGPAAWIGHLANLARPAEEVGGPDGGLAWYPLSAIMLQLAGLVTLGLIVFGLIVGYGSEIVGHIVDAFLQVVEQQDASYRPDPKVVAEMKTFLVHALPAVQGAVWVILLFAACYIAAALVRISGRGHRPRDDVPAGLKMPRVALIPLAIGLVLAFLDGVPSFIGSAICGAFGAGFMLSGFAVLHDRTRGLAWRFAALWLAYVTVILFTIPLVLFFFAGLLETAGAIPAKRSGPHHKK